MYIGYQSASYMWVCMYMVYNRESESLTLSPIVGTESGPSLLISVLMGLVLYFSSSSLITVGQTVQLISTLRRFFDLFACLNSIN